MHTFVALLRGVNVGGRSIVPMGRLRATFEALGHADVQTYLNSGNVLFRSASGPARDLAAKAERALAQAFGRDIAVVLRTGAELARVVGVNPFREAASDPARLAVVFLAAAPPASAVGRLDPGRSPGDAFSAAGREIYLHCPNGFARTKLTNDWFERQLGTAATARNWRTVTELAARARALAGA